jgi:hypothetical protein
LSDDVWSFEEDVTHGFFLQVIIPGFSSRIGISQHDRMKTVQVLQQANLDECQGYSEGHVVVVSLLENRLECILVMQIEERLACVIPFILFVRHNRIPFDKVVRFLIIAKPQV